MRKILTLFTALLLLGSASIVLADTYVVAGTMNGWNTSANGMSQVGTSDIYSTTINDLAATSHQFKVVANGSSWLGTGNVSKGLSDIDLSGSDNIEFTLSSKSDVTFYFDASNQKIFVHAGVTVTYTIVGDLDLTGAEWNTSLASNDMALQGDGKTYQLTKTNVAFATTGDKEFKVVRNHAWANGDFPVNNVKLNIASTGTYDVTFTFVPSTATLTAVATPVSLAPLPPPSVKMRGAFFSSSWADTEDFDLDASEEFASITLENISAGDHAFKVVLDGGTWRGNGGTFTRTNNSAAIPENGSDMTFTADFDGDYTFTWTYDGDVLSVTYPTPPAQTVDFDGLASTILKGNSVNFAATSTGITNPVYSFYVKPAGSGSYGSPVTSYTFNTLGDFAVKVEATGDNTSSPIVKEVNVSIYETHTFTSGTKLYIDFTAMTEESEKGVNFPSADAAYASAYDAVGAGTLKTVTFTADVTWSTLNDFIKTEKDGWDPGMKFSVPAEGQNCIRVAADGNSYTWDSYVDIFLVGSFNGWNTTSHQFVKANAGDTEASVTINITEYSDVTFKVIDNGAWRGCNPAKKLTQADNSVTILSDAEGYNVGLTLYAAGNYVFTLNLSTRVLTVTYPEGEPMDVPIDLFLAGDMNSWATDNDSYKFDVNGDLATLEVALKAEEELEFKLYNHGYLGADYNFNYYWCTDVAFTSTEGKNAKIYTFKAGTYTFTYTISTGLLTIGFPATTATEITIGSHEYATLFSATGYDVPNEVEAYMITGNSGTALTMQRIWRIPAETGVLLHAPQGTYNFYEGDSRFMGVEHTEDNLLKGTLDEATIADNGKIHYVLSYDNSGNVGFFWPNGTGDGIGAFTNGTGKAYLELGSQSAGIIARRGFPLVVGQATGIDAVKNGEKAVKFVENGQLFILRDGKLYNAQGLIVK